MNDLSKINTTLFICTAFSILFSFIFFGVGNLNRVKSQKEVLKQLDSMQSDLKQTNARMIELQKNLAVFSAKINSIDKSVSSIDSTKKITDKKFIEKQSQLQEKLTSLDAKIGDLHLTIIE